MNTFIERMSDQFTKVNFQIGKFSFALHHFTGPDIGHPHDHPFAFTTTILKGGYIEEVWKKNGNYWWSTMIHRKPGTSHRVEAGDIHKIISLPEGECVTSVEWEDFGEDRKDVYFYKLVNLEMFRRKFDSDIWEKA